MSSTRSMIVVLCAVACVCSASEALAQPPDCDALVKSRDALAEEARSYAQVSRSYVELLSQARALRPEVMRASTANLNAFLAGARQQIADNRRAQSAATEAGVVRSYAITIQILQAMQDFIAETLTRRAVGDQPEPGATAFDRALDSADRNIGFFGEDASRAADAAKDADARIGSAGCPPAPDQSSGVVGGPRSETASNNLPSSPPLTPGTAAQFSPPPIAIARGRWTSSFGDLIVQLSDTNFSASLPDGQSHVTGQIVGGQLVGTYFLGPAATGAGGAFAIMDACPAPLEGARVWGRVGATLEKDAAGKIIAFSGYYSLCDEEPGRVPGFRFSGSYAGP